MNFGQVEIIDNGQVEMMDYTGQVGQLPNVEISLYWRVQRKYQTGDSLDKLLLNYKRCSSSTIMWWCVLNLGALLIQIIKLLLCRIVKSLAQVPVLVSLIYSKNVTVVNFNYLRWIEIFPWFVHDIRMSIYLLYTVSYSVSCVLWRAWLHVYR